jgi:enoyl-CoA hydratase/carnithine racemase
MIMTKAPSSAQTQNPDEPLVLIDDHDGYAVLTLNRPAKRNAMSREAVRQLREALAVVRDKQAVVLTGADPAFCAGVDLSEQTGDGFSSRSSQQTHYWTEVQADIRSHPAIFIAAVNGYALGGGSTLIHSCDLAIAAESAQIGAPEMGFGGFPSHAGPAAVKRLAPKHAAQIILLARRVDAHEALRMAIVNKVVPDDQLLAEATDWAEQLATFNPVALDWGKRTIQAMENLSWDDAIAYTEMTSRVVSGQTPATRDGIAAFLRGHRGVGQGA